MDMTVKGLDGVAKNMEDRMRKLPLAVYNALNVTGNDIVRNVRNVMKNVFDRPTPFILRSIESKVFIKGDMTLTVWVDPFNTQAIEVLKPEIFGGPRALKRSELWLRSAGILPAGKYLAPAAEQFLDQYGNFRGQEMVQIVSSLKAFGEQGYLMNKTARSRGKNKNRYFVMYRSGVPIGIWERLGAGSNNTKAVLLFISRPQYKARLDFFGIAQSTAVATFKPNLDRMVGR